MDINLVIVISGTILLLCIGGDEVISRRTDIVPDWCGTLVALSGLSSFVILMVSLILKLWS